MEKKLINKELNEYEITLKENEAMYFYPREFNPEFAHAIAFGHSVDKITVTYFENGSICNFSINGVCLFNVDYKLVTK